MVRPFEKPICVFGGNQSRKGQAAIEYVLLLVVVTTIAALLVKSCVSRDPSSPGLVIDAWNKTGETIGKDKADEVKSDNPQ